MVNILVITHGSFGGYLLEAAEGIVGPLNSGVAFLGISSRKPITELREIIEKKIDEMAGADGLIIMADMVGGTPMNLALPIVKDRPRVEIVTGVSLYMLVSGLTHRGHLELAALTEKVLSDGIRSCKNIKAMLRTKVN